MIIHYCAYTVIKTERRYVNAMKNRALRQGKESFERHAVAKSAAYLGQTSGAPWRWPRRQIDVDIIYGDVILAVASNVAVCLQFLAVNLCWLSRHDGSGEGTSIIKARSSKAAHGAILYGQALDHKSWELAPLDERLYSRMRVSTFRWKKTKKNHRHAINCVYWQTSRLFIVQSMDIDEN